MPRHPEGCRGMLRRSESTKWDLSTISCCAFSGRVKRLAQAGLRLCGCGSKIGTAYWNPGKWKHGPKIAVPWWFNFDPYPSEAQPGNWSSLLGSSRRATHVTSFISYRPALANSINRQSNGHSLKRRLECWSRSAQCRGGHPNNCARR